VGDAQADILQALLALGYSDKEAAAALKALPKDVGVERRYQAGVEVFGQISLWRTLHLRGKLLFW